MHAACCSQVNVAMCCCTKRLLPHFLLSFSLSLLYQHPVVHRSTHVGMRRRGARAVPIKYWLQYRRLSGTHPCAPTFVLLSTNSVGHVHPHLFFCQQTQLDTSTTQLAPTFVLLSTNSVGHVHPHLFFCQQKLSWTRARHNLHPLLVFCRLTLLIKHPSDKMQKSNAKMQKKKRKKDENPI
jgi:hypothetical protein